MTETGQASPGGRPRDPSIDERVLETTREMLVEHGWEATTVRGVARAAGVSRAAVLRRWPSKAQLVLDAVIGEAPDMAPFEGLDRAGWVRWVATASVEIFDRPVVRAAAPGLLAAIRDQPELRDALWQTFTSAPVEVFAEQGDAPADAALDARAIIVLAAGAALFASVLAGDQDTPELRARVEEILLASTRPS